MKDRTQNRAVDRCALHEEPSVEAKLDDIVQEQARIAASLKTLSSVLELLAVHIPDGHHRQTCLCGAIPHPVQAAH